MVPEKLTIALNVLTKKLNLSIHNYALFDMMN